jgi:ProP effector
MSIPDPRAQGGHAGHGAAKLVPRKLIAMLATRFPAAFVADRRQPHKPLKIGVDADLIASRILTPGEVKSALRCYTNRRMYHVATASGGLRFDLDGNACGQVTPRASAWAGAQLARMDAAAAAERRNAAPASRKAPPDEKPSNDVQRRLSLAEVGGDRAWFEGRVMSGCPPIKFPVRDLLDIESDEFDRWIVAQDERDHPQERFDDDAWCPDLVGGGDDDAVSPRSRRRNPGG